MWNIENRGRSPSVIYDSAGRPRTVLPGRTIPVDITPRAASRFDRSRSLVVTDENGKPPEKLASRPVSERGKKRSRALASETAALRRAEIEVETEIEKNLTRSEQAAEIVRAHREQEITYPEAVEKAKALLGDEWPGGTPKKSVLYELLENVSD